MAVITELITWLYVEDLARSMRFYEEGLGLGRVLHQGDCAIYRVVGDAYLGLCARAEPRQTPGLLLCFVTEDVQGQYDRLLRAGAVSEQAPRQNDGYGIVHAFLRDPDGHRIEVQRFLDPGWKG
jgi:catechol 2,3-dioxygenase-like lactoylglutathione lyase family enzyme